MVRSQTQNFLVFKFEIDQRSQLFSCYSIFFFTKIDRFSLSYGGVSVPVYDTGIAWTTDKNVKFRNPATWSGTIQPKNWTIPVQNLSSDPSNTGYQNEDLIVWMRTAALPSFRKLFRRVAHDNSTTFTNNLPAGQYSISIDYSNKHT